MKMNPSILLLPALLALSSGVAVAQTYDTQHGYRYRDYADPAYGYRDAYPQIEAAPQPYEGQPEAGTYQLQQPYQPYGPNQALQQPAPSAPPAGDPPVAANPPAPVVPALVPATFIAQANEAVLPDSLKRSGKQAIPAIARLQILLDRANVSPGVIDGMTGGNLAKAVSALENMNGMPSTGRMGPQIDAILASFGGTPVLVPYVITAADAAGPFVPVIPKDYGEMAQLPRLAYRNAGEALAERFHMDEGFLRRLNPGAGFAEGETITVADVGPPARTKVYHLVADSAARQLLGYDQQWNLVVAYPATIGSTDMPSPSGIHAVKAIAIDPVYWYRPKVNFQQGKNDKALKLAPGPNGPVGAVWIGLDKPTYGIHGTPEPSRIDKTNSHGCLRLTNWDANELAHLVRPGVDVEFVDPARTASVAPAAPPAVAPAEQPMPPPLAQ